MQHIRTILVATAVTVGMVTGATAATELTMASGLPASIFFSKNYMQFIKEVEDATGGEVKIKYYGNNSLVKRDGIRRAIQSNQIQMGEVDFVNLGNENPVFRLDTLPALAQDYDSAWKLMEAQKPLVNKLFAERGLRILGYAPWPGQGFYTKVPVAKIDDFKGIKLRIYSKPTKTMGEMLGFRPTILPAAEVPQAFATGMVDAMLTSPQTGVITQAWDNTKYFLSIGSIYAKQSLVINEKAFQSLSPAAQKALIEAGERATKRGWELSKKEGAEKMQVLEDNGMTVTHAWPALIKRLDEIGMALLEDWKKDAPPEAVAVLDSYLKAKM